MGEFGLDSYGCGSVTVANCCGQNNELLGSIKGGEFMD
jgi:hypothetical protein